MNNRDDENLEKMIFEFCKNDKEAPSYVDKAVKDGLERCRNLPAKRSKFYILRRVAVILICCGLLATGGAFAINYIISLFTNSTPGIDSAVENGFVHDIDMDFVYDNNIGIKIDSVVMSTTALDISFVYDCPDYDDVSKINIYEYEITDEDGNLIAKVSEQGLNVESLSNEFNDNKNNYVEILDNYYKNSVLFKGYNYSISEKLYFSITKIFINDNTTHYISGNWSFAINLEDNLAIEIQNLSILNQNEYVKNIKSYLNETTFIVDLELTEKLDKTLMYDLNNIILMDSENNVYYYDTFTILENKLHLEFCYGKYNLEGELYLQITIPENKIICLILN